MRIDIKAHFTGAVLFSLDVEINSIRITLEAAVEARAYLARAYLAGANLAGANLAGAYLAGAYLAGADLAGAYLTGAYLTGAYLAGADLTGANLAGAYLAGAYLAGADLADAYLAGAYLAGADLAGADLADAYLARAYLAGADLTGADLARANLAGAYLAGADLADAYLTDAYLTDADLTGADLTGAYRDAAVPREPYDRMKPIDYAARAARYRETHPDIPIVPNLDAAILAAITTGGGKLDMSNWHTCETTHCRAGWAITLAGEAGRKLEREHGPQQAGRMIYRASTGRAPYFFASNERALEDIKACAAASEATP